MEGLFALFVSGVVLLPTLVVAALITFAAVRGVRKKYVSATSLVLESFSINPAAAPGEPVIHIFGRHKGFISWILTNLGMSNRVELAVTEKEWTLREGSLAGMLAVCAPLKRIRATICGSQRSLLAFFLAVFFALNAAWTLLGVFPILVGALHLDSEAGWEAAATKMATVLFVIFGWLVACGIAAIIYYASKRVAFGADVGKVYGIVFKRSFIENAVIDLDEAEKATALLNRLVAAAVYDLPLAQIPSPSAPAPAAPKPGKLLAWMAGVTYAGLVLLAVVLSWYGSGVALRISTAPAGAAVFLDNNFVGASKNETGFILLAHITRERHTLVFQCQGYEPLTQVVSVGGLESSQDVAVKLAPLHYPVTVVTTPGNSQVAVDGSRVAADGKDIGISNEAGLLTIPSVDRGEHEFTVSHDGYRTFTVKINVDRRESLRFNLVNEAEAARQGADAARQGADAARQEAEARQREAAGHLERGRMLYRQGQYQGASDECDSALKIDPSNAAAQALKKQIEQTRKILSQ